MKTRLKRFTTLLALFSLWIALCGIWLASPVLADEPFSDDAQRKIQELIKVGLIEGSPEGESELDMNMTRAQIARVVSLLLGLEQSTASSPIYRDVSDSHWAAGYINAVASEGIMVGNGNGQFNPDNSITWEQIAVIVARAVGLEVDETSTVDGSVPDWAAPYVVSAVDAGLIERRSSYTEQVSGSEMADIVDRLDSVIPTCLSESALSIAGSTLDLEGDKTLSITFSGKVDRSSVQEASFSVNGTSLELGDDQYVLAEDGKTLMVTLGDNFDWTPPAAGDSSISVSHVRSACGNPMEEGENTVALEVVNAPSVEQEPRRARVIVSPSPSPGSEQPPVTPSIAHLQVTVTETTYSNIFVAYTNIDRIHIIAIEDMNPPPTLVELKEPIYWDGALICESIDVGPAQPSLGEYSGRLDHMYPYNHYTNVVYYVLGVHGGGEVSSIQTFTYELP